MARLLSKRLTLTGTLLAKMPLHVGGVPDSVEADMPLARNGLGYLYVPGTSLAGVFRTWMERHFNNTEVLDNLWGFHQPKKFEGAASRILVEDAKVSLPPGLPEELWDSIGIERRWGTAANSQKFDRTVLPKGSTLDLCLHVDLPSEDTANAMRAMLGYLIKALEAGQIVLGAATTRGLGQVELISTQLREVDWTRKDSVLKWLADDTKAQTINDISLIEADKTLACRQLNILQVKIDWAPIGPLMVKASYDGIAVDILPKVSGVDGGLMALVLPGSSLKGALRHQAERIVRTVLNQQDLADDWLDQVQVPLVEYIFGAAKKPSKKYKSVKVAGRGCLSVHTCYAKNTLCSPQQWQQVEAAQTSAEKAHPLYDALNDVGLRETPYFEQGFHVAIDRWTGGAAEGFLYSAIEPFGVEWDPIEIRFDLSEDRLPSEYQAPALTLLLLLLRDLSEQRLTVGFGVNRGYGTLSAKKITFQWEETSEPEKKHWLDGKTLEVPFSLNQLPAADLQVAWQAWINAQRVG